MAWSASPIPGFGNPQAGPDALSDYIAQMRKLGVQPLSPAINVANVPGAGQPSASVGGPPSNPPPGPRAPMTPPPSFGGTGAGAIPTLSEGQTPGVPLPHPGQSMTAGTPLPPTRPPVTMGAPGASAGVGAGASPIPLPPQDPRKAQAPFQQFGTGHGQNADSQNFFTMNDAAHKDPTKGPPPPGAGIFDFASSGAMDAFHKPGQVADAAHAQGANPIQNANPPQEQAQALQDPSSWIMKLKNFFG